MPAPATSPPGRPRRPFPDPTGEWWPEFDQTAAGLVLRGYRLHVNLRVPQVRAPYRPKG